MVSSLLAACTEQNMPPPMCRVDSTVEQNISANAGCIIRVRNKMVTVQHRLSGKLDIPGGTSDSFESAACTAHRETWEETGFNVKVLEHLGTNENGFRYYACELAGNFTGEITEFPVPDSAKGEITGIQLTDPFEMAELDWRFKNRLPALRAMFNKTPGSETQSPQQNGQ